MAKVIMEDEGSIPTRTQQHYLYFGEDAIPVCTRRCAGGPIDATVVHAAPTREALIPWDGGRGGQDTLARFALRR